MALTYLWVADDLVVGAPAAWVDRIAGQSLAWTAGATPATIEAADAVIGHKFARFPASCTSNWQTVTFTAGALTRPYSLHVLAAYSGATDQDSYLVDGGAAATQSGILQSSSGAGAPSIDAGTLITGTDGTAFSSSVVAISAHFNGTGELWQDDVSLATGGAGAEIMNGVTIGMSVALTLPFQGDIYAVAIDDGYTAARRFEIDMEMMFQASGGAL